MYTLKYSKQNDKIVIAFQNDPDYHFDMASFSSCLVKVSDPSWSWLKETDVDSW